MANSRITKPFYWVGGILLAIGIVVLGGASIFGTVQAFTSDPDIPAVISIAVVAVAIGFALLLAALIVERLSGRQKNDFEEREN